MMTRRLATCKGGANKLGLVFFLGNSLLKLGTQEDNQESVLDGSFNFSMVRRIIEEVWDRCLLTLLQCRSMCPWETLKPC